MKMSLPILACAVALGSASPVFAHGNVTCNAGPKSKWKPISELTKSIKTQGWTVRKAKVEKDCYEVYGTTPEGDRVEAFFHPVSLKKMMVMRRGQMLYMAPKMKK